MLRTLRGRFILSHVLPLLVIVPLMGIALVYVLETRILLPSIVDELTGDAALIAEITSYDPETWHEPARAQAVLDRLGSMLTVRVMFLDPTGQLLASSDPLDGERLDQVLARPDLAKVQAGEISVHTEYSSRLHSEVADVWAPAIGSDGQVIGVIRLTHRLATVYEDFVRLRYLIAGVLATGLLLGSGVGLVLALNLERPLQRVTEAVFQLASGQRLTSLPERGPTETRRLLRAVNTLAERLRGLEEARRKLLANLVHELGRPLGALSSTIHALRSGAGEDAELRDELLTGMAMETQHLQRLLDDLAQLHEQVLGILELDRQPISLSKWLPPTLAAWREAAFDKGVEWQTAIATDLPTLEVDPDRLGQCLGNLISNAIKYTPPAGTVTVAAGTTDDMAWVKVQDTGPGISLEKQEHIFTPFYRGQSNGRFAQGMGLGLSIARDLLVAHGGRLAVESTPGEGTTFTCWLPLKATGVIRRKTDA